MDLIADMRRAGAQLIYLGTDEAYFQYGRTYRRIEKNAIERVDHSVMIVIHDHDSVQVLFNPTPMSWWNWKSRLFKTLKGALDYSERN